MDKPSSFQVCVYFIFLLVILHRAERGAIYNNGHCIEKEEEIVIEDGGKQ